jgi:hypothetical protein
MPPSSSWRLCLPRYERRECTLCKSQSYVVPGMGHEPECPALLSHPPGTLPTNPLVVGAIAGFHPPGGGMDRKPEEVGVGAAGQVVAVRNPSRSVSEAAEVSVSGRHVTPPGFGRETDTASLMATSPVGVIQEGSVMSDGDAPATALDVAGFYRDLLWELGEHAQRGGTAIGAAVVAKRVARKFGIDVAERLPLPRLTRAEESSVRDSREGW